LIFHFQEFLYHLNPPHSNLNSLIKFKMVNVLVIGATGYIGQALTQSLLRSGNHRAYGLARTPEKAQSLIKDEVIPILGSISDPAEFLRCIDALHINVVVDVAGANHESHFLLELLKPIGKNRIANHSPKLGFIYTSGTWVHGSSNAPVNDLTPVGLSNSPTQPAKLVAWRTKMEQEVLAASDALDVMIIRPALVYGRSNAIWTPLLQPIYSAAKSGASTASVAAELNSRPGLVHVDDVGLGLHSAVEKLPLISGTGIYPVFDLQTSQESMKDILDAAAREFGFKGTVKLAGVGDDLFADAMSTSGNICSGRAKTILGWEPKRLGFVGQMDVSARAWIAHAKL
jgi:nucleoside-diphosphate-sugar epimerase